MRQILVLRVLKRARRIEPMSTKLPKPKSTRVSMRALQCPKFLLGAFAVPWRPATFARLVGNHVVAGEALPRGVTAKFTETPSDVDVTVFDGHFGGVEVGLGLRHIDSLPAVRGATTNSVCQLFDARSTSWERNCFSR